MRRSALLISVLLTPLFGQVRPSASWVRLQEAALASEEGYQKLGWLCDRIGNRLSGSKQLEQAIQWAVTTMKAEGFDNVHTEKVMVPHWVRGREFGELLSPKPTRLNLLGLGGTAPTPKGGLTADVVVVGSFEELKALGEAKVKGKIVCFDVPFTDYGTTVAYRGNGAIEAAKLGGVAALIRSVSPVSLDTPHTGAMRYDKDVPRIPAAALTLESTTQMRRMQERGDRITMKLELENKTLPDIESANVVAEIRGSEKPEEIVLISGHLDSWDVGQGAQDDGVGCMNVWEAARLIRQVGLKPKRTIRVVLFTNEENGLRGGLAYRDAHKAELPLHLAMLESDGGNGLIRGFELELAGIRGGGNQASAEALPSAQTEILEKLRAFAPAFETLGGGIFAAGHSGADIGPSVQLGVPGIGVDHHGGHYWDIHHTWADTFDKVDKKTMQKNIAIIATLTYLLADLPGTLQ